MNPHEGGLQGPVASHGSRSLLKPFRSREGAHERVFHVPAQLFRRVVQAHGTREQLALPPARHIFVTREDVSRVSRVLAKVQIGKVVPLTLHLQCEWRDGGHEVPNQPGRTFFVVDNKFAILNQQGFVRAAVNVGAVALKAGGAVVPGMRMAGEIVESVAWYHDFVRAAVNVGAVALKAGGAVVPGMRVAGEVVGEVGRRGCRRGCSVAWYQGFPVYDDTIESFSERLGSQQSDPGWEEELRALVEEDLQQCVPGAWMKEFYNRHTNSGLQEFKNDFLLTEVVYADTSLTALLCGDHCAKGRDQGLIRKMK